MLKRSPKWSAAMVSTYLEIWSKEPFQRPDNIARRGAQTFSTLVLDDRFGLSVVHKERKGIMVVMIFYPIERKRVGLWDEVRLIRPSIRHVERRGSSHTPTRSAI